MPVFPHLQAMAAASSLGLCLAFIAMSTATAAEDHLDFPGGPGLGQGKHVVLIAGDDEYRSEESLPMLAKILSKRHGFACTVLFSAEDDGTVAPTKGESLTHPQALDGADAIVMLARFRHWPDEAMKHFVDAYLAGTPIIALRTSTHAFKTSGTFAAYSYDAKAPWPGGFGREVLGETWVSHHGDHKKQGTRAIIEAAHADAEVLRGVSGIFGDTDVYTAAPPADARILLRGQVTASLQPDSAAVEGPKNEPMMPVAWTRALVNAAGKTNRVLCTTMGAATDLRNEGLRRLVVNGVIWGVGLEVPAAADVTLVDPYAPSAYGFGGNLPGLKVADLELGKPFPPLAH
jgi:hypothetical protein